jgi:hypothetical protein
LSWTKPRKLTSSTSSEGSTEGLGPFAQNIDVKNTNNISNNCRKSSNNEIDITNSSSQSHNEDLGALEEPSAPSAPSADDTIEQQLPNSIYRIGHSDLFGCNNCKVKGDKPFMMNHPRYCREARKSNKTKFDGEVIE